MTGILVRRRYDASLGAKQLLMQAIGCLVLIVVGGGLSFAFFKIQNRLTKGGIRSDEEDELAGLDLPEMGVLAYPEFAGALGSYGSGDGGSVVKTPVHT